MRVWPAEMSRPEHGMALRQSLHHIDCSWSTAFPPRPTRALCFIAPQDVKCVVAAVPKSIDNDILLIDKCFGFDTAVEEAQRALLAAKVGSW